MLVECGMPSFVLLEALNSEGQLARWCAQSSNLQEKPKLVIIFDLGRSGGPFNNQVIILIGHYTE